MKNKNLQDNQSIIIIIQQLDQVIRSIIVIYRPLDYEIFDGIFNQAFFFFLFVLIPLFMVTFFSSKKAIAHCIEKRY